MATESSFHPTGFSPAALPFWEKLDPGGFEDFCTSLLNCHPVVETPRGPRRILNAQRLLSGAKQDGVDIRVDAEEGEVWVIQCKRVQRFGPADVEAALRLAESTNPLADQHILVTACGLTAEAQAPMRASSKWLWWGPDRLTTIASLLEPAEAGPKLVQRFFGEEWVRRLFPWGGAPYVDWREFFRRELEEGGSSLHHRTRFVGADVARKRLVDFAEGRGGRALVLAAAGGQGKSRLLLELARDLEDRAGRSRIRFLNLGRRSLTDRELEFLRRDRDLVLVVDDAHRLTETLGDILRAAGDSETLRLILATRPNAEPDLRRRLHDARLSEKIEDTLFLGRWAARDMVALAEETLGTRLVVQAPRLAGLSDGCPLLVILGAGLLRGGQPPESLAGEASFRERVVQGWIAELLETLPADRRERMHRVLRLLALVGPEPNRPEFRTRAAGMLGMRPLDFAEDVEALVAGGWAVQTREGVRLVPDLVADAVVVGECIRESGGPSPLAEALVEQFHPADFPSLLRNLAQADWDPRTGSGAAGPVFAKAWTAFTERFHGAEPGERARLLDRWVPVAGFQPQLTLDLVDRILEADRKRTLPATDRSARGRLPEMLRPIVEWHPQWAEGALDRLWRLAEDRGDDGSYPPMGDPIGAIARAAAYAVNKPLAATESVLNWLRRTLRSDAGRKRLQSQPDMFSALLKPFFARAVEQQWETGFTLHLRTLSVRAETTRTVRSSALELVEEWLTPDVPEVTRSAVAVLGEALRSAEVPGNQDTGEAERAAWRPDRLAALEVARRATERLREKPVLLLLLRRRLSAASTCEHDPEFRSAARDVLAGLPDSPELRLLRGLTSSVHAEIPGVRRADGSLDWEEADRRWRCFCAEAATETWARLGSPRVVVDELRRWTLELKEAGLAAHAASLLASMLESAPIRAPEFLEEILRLSDEALDSYSGPILEALARHTPSQYEDCLRRIPAMPRPSLRGSLLQTLVHRYSTDGSLLPGERAAIEALARDADEGLRSWLALWLPAHFGREANWAANLLASMPIGEGVTANAVLDPLDHLAETGGSNLAPDAVARCLVRCRGVRYEDGMDTRPGERLAATFPRELYEALREAVDTAASESGWERRLLVRSGGASLGRIADEEFWERELRLQWQLATQAEPASRREERLALVRSLISAGTRPALEVHRELLESCSEDGSLVALAELVAPTRSDFPLRSPGFCLEALSRAVPLGMAPAVQEVLVNSISTGGVRTNGQPGAKDRARLEQAGELATEHGAHPLLGPLYRRVHQLMTGIDSGFRNHFAGRNPDLE